MTLLQFPASPTGIRPLAGSTFRPVSVSHAALRTRSTPEHFRGAPSSTRSAVGAASATLALAAWSKHVRGGRVQRQAAEGMASSEGKEKAGADLLEAASKAAAARRLEQAESQEIFDAKLEAGVTDPIGFFDPLGFCPTGDKENFRRLRTSEIKHGRVAMMASIGLVAQHYIRFPFSGGFFDEVPNGLFALTDWTAFLGLVGLIWGCLLFEFVIFAQDPTKEVGDFGDPFRVGMNSREMRDREINNGRFAMFATIGILIAELVTGNDAMEQLGLA